jgi:hypothetical protein
MIHARAEATIEAGKTRVIAQYRKNHSADWVATGQHQIIFEQLVDKIARYSAQQGESPDTFEARVADALALLDDIQRGTNKKLYEVWDEKGKSEEEKKKEYDRLAPIVWRRGEPKFAFEAGFKSSFHVTVDTIELAAAAARYLQRPWMQSNFLEWIFLDAFIFHEIVQFGDAVKQKMPGKRDWLGMNRAYNEYAGDLTKMTGASARRTLAMMAGLWLGPPLLVAATYVPQKEYVAAALLTGGWWGLLTMVGVAHTTFRRFVPKPKTYWESGIELWREMQDIYYFLGGAVLNPTLLREKVMAVTEKGARFDNTVYALLDLIVRRDPSVFVCFEERGR